MLSLLDGVLVTGCVFFLVFLSIHFFIMLFLVLLLWGFRHFEGWGYGKILQFLYVFCLSKYFCTLFCN